MPLITRITMKHTTYNTHINATRLSILLLLLLHTSCSWMVAPSLLMLSCATRLTDLVTRAFKRKNNTKVDSSHALPHTQPSPSHLALLSRRLQPTHVFAALRKISLPDMSLRPEAWFWVLAAPAGEKRNNQTSCNQSISSQTEKLSIKIYNCRNIRA